MSTSAADIRESRPLGKRGTPGLMCCPAASGSYPCVMILHERTARARTARPNVQRFRNALEERKPGRYRPQPAAAAWDEIVTFLKAKLAPGANGHSEVSWTFRSVKSVNYDFTKAVREA
jgi:hypothetical protein